MTASAQKVRVAPGIRKDRYGWEAYIKVKGHQYSRRFPSDATVTEMRLWRSQQKAQLVGLTTPFLVVPEFKKLSGKLPRSTNGWCYVYFIQDGDTVKIGRALDPHERWRNLQTAHARPLSLILAIPAHASLEEAIHKRFAHLLAGGTEWFRLAPELIRFIRECQTGRNPVALLW